MADWGFSASLDTLNPDELRQRLQSLEAIIARAPVPIAIAHDPECRFISANRALATLLDLPEVEQHLADAGQRSGRRIASSATAATFRPRNCRCSMRSRIARS